MRITAPRKRWLHQLLPSVQRLALRASHFFGARSARDQKNSPSRFRFRPPCRPTFGFRLRPPGWASTYSRSVLGANGTVEVSRGPFKACPNAKFAICKKFSFQHFPQLGKPVCGQICGQAAGRPTTSCRATPSELPTEVEEPPEGGGSAPSVGSGRRKPREEGGKEPFCPNLT
jgi:hypothetical protein